MVDVCIALKSPVMAGRDSSVLETDGHRKEESGSAYGEWVKREGGRVRGKKGEREEVQMRENKI